MLIFTLCFACVACNNNPTDPVPDTGNNGDDSAGGNNGGNNGGDSTKKDPSTQDLFVKEIIDSYASAWIINNNEANRDLSNALQTEITNLRNKNYQSTISALQVQKDGDTYVIKYRFTDKSESTTTINIPAVNNGNYAGYEYDNVTSTKNADEMLGSIINALFKSIKAGAEDGADFYENGIGFDGVAYFDFFYGDMDKSVSYGLRLAGQFGLSAKDTFAAIEAVDADNNVLGGLYYEGAENKADSRLYLNAGDYKYYIDSADINAIVLQIIEMIQSGSNSGDDSVVSSAEDEPFYNMEITKLTDLFSDIQISGISISGIVSSLLTEVVPTVSEKELDNGTRYQVMIDIDGLMGSLVKSLGDIIQGMNIIQSLPEPLNQLDLSSLQGVGGALLITAIVDNNGLLSDIEISYNCGVKDFRFSSEDTESKVYGPINVALGIKDFNVGLQNKADILPSFESYKYFSPLNASITLETTVNAEKYVTEIVSDVNPFDIENAVITFVTKKDNADFLSGRITPIDGGVHVKCGEMVIHTTVNELAFSAYDSLTYIYGMVLESETSIFTPIVSYINGLIAEFAPVEQPPVENPDSIAAAGDFDISSITNAFGIIDAAEELIENWEKNGVFSYEIVEGNILDSYIEINLDSARYNEVIDLINKYFSFIPEIGQLDETAPKIYINYNHGDYEKILYVKVEAQSKTVIVKLDGSKLTEGQIVLDVNVDAKLYKAVLDISAWNEKGKATLNFTIDGTEYADITLDIKAQTFVADLTSNGTEYRFAGSLVLDDKSAEITINLNGVEVKVNGGNAFFSKNELTTSFGVNIFTAGVDFGWEIPNDKTSVSVKVTLNSWGETVKVADNASIIEEEATVTVDQLLETIEQIILQKLGVSSGDSAK